MRQRAQKAAPGLEAGRQAQRWRIGSEGSRSWSKERGGAPENRGCGQSGERKKHRALHTVPGDYSLPVVSHSIETPRTREKITSSKSATRRLPVSIRLIAI